MFSDDLIETSVGGIIRKVMKVIREEFAGVNSQVGSGTTTPTRPPSSLSFSSASLSIPTPPLANLVLLGRAGMQSHHLAATNVLLRSPMPGTLSLEPDASFTDPSKKAFAMKPALIDAIQEVINELETVYENVAKNAREYIHPEFVNHRP